MNKEPNHLKFPQVSIVEASAGSGKTYALAKRYVQLLLDSQNSSQEPPFKNILAITFTNKAALEMKERILEFLKKMALDGQEQPMSASAYALMDSLIRNYNFFQVETIDSFINSILYGCAFKFGLCAGFEIKTDYRDYLSYSLDALIDKANNDASIRHMFLNFLKQYIYIENKTGWLPKKDILSVVTNLFYLSNIYGAGFQKAKASMDDLFTLKKAILKELNELKNVLPQGTDKRFYNNLSAFLEANKDTFDIVDISTYFRREAPPVNKGCALPDKVLKLWDKIRSELKNLCEMEFYCLFNCYIEVFNAVSGYFQSLSKKDDVLFLEELNHKARLLFDEQAVTVPEIYYRLATRFRHYLIDEFQDTSLLQWRNLLLMVEEALSSGGSLFYVGDKKQAIYGFRGGEVSLFDSLKKEFKAFGVIEQEPLLKNFRSHKEIVEFNNRVFSADNLSRFLRDKNNYEQSRKNNFKLFSEAEIKDITDNFKGSIQGYNPRNQYGYVKVEFTDADIKEQTISLIKELGKRFSYKDIAILARKNDDVKLITEWLLKNNMPVESEKTLNIREHPLIKELVSFLKFLNSPIDNLYFSSFILGDIFAKVSGLDKQAMRDFIFGIRLRASREDNIYFYKEFRDKFKDAWDNWLAEFFKNVGFVPLYELVVSIVEKFAILKNFSEYQGFFMRFLELIIEQEGENQSLGKFLEFFDNAKDEDLYVNVTDTNSIKVITIHKSKGLEFGVVIVPFLEITAEVSSAIVRYQENGLGLFHWQNAYMDYSGVLREVYKQEYKKSLIDELNGIYVALTRPKYELYIFIPPKSPKGFNLANLLIPKENGDSAHFHKAHILEKWALSPFKKEPALIELPASEYRDWIPYLKDELIKDTQVRNRQKILRGEVLHYILSFIGNLFNEDADNALKNAFANARSRFPFIKDWQDLAERVRKLCLDRKFERFFFVPDGTVCQEKEIVDKFGNTKRIDRLVITQAEAYVIDYKSAKDSQADYIEQVQKYTAIIKDIYPRLKVRGFLVYLDDLDIEQLP